MNANNQIPWIGPEMNFPHRDNEILSIPEYNGLLAASDRLCSKMLIKAYNLGIFPWSGQGQPILWWSPNPRMVLKCEDFILRNSLKKKIRSEINNGLTISCNKDFLQVIRSCAEPKKGRENSWITGEIVDSYYDLHKQGIAHSIEVWENQKLVGGLYVISIGKMVFGESMFSKKNDASKIALTALVKWLIKNHAEIIDCQQDTPHLASLGARPIPRKKFETINKKLTRESKLPWQVNPISTKILYQV